MSAGYHPGLGCFSHRGCTLWDPESQAASSTLRAACNGSLGAQYFTVHCRAIARDVVESLPDAPRHNEFACGVCIRRGCHTVRGRRGRRHKTELGRRPRRARGGHRHRGAIANAGLCCGEELRGLEHPGVLDAKVGYFGVKSAKVQQLQMGTKPAKVGRLPLAPGVLKCGAAPTPHRRAPPQKGLRSTPRAKWS